ncbi:hypothetical protein NKG05_25660 [Oerskovia sp. M15]
MTATPGQALDVTFTSTIIADSNSGWPCVQMPDSANFFGTGKAVKIGAPWMDTLRSHHAARGRRHPHDATTSGVSETPREEHG